MEMVEGHNQRKIAPNRIKFEEIMEEGEEDRISSLPDCLLVEILSLLPSTKDAIQTGTLSKRWKYLWTLVHTLIFTFMDFNNTSDFAPFVDKTLTHCRQLKLKKFEVYSIYYIQSYSLYNRWILYAISCDVEELIFTLWPKNSDFQLDQSVYISSCFTDLTLARCKLNPNRAISWKNLRSLSISYVKVDEDLIENILSGSPLLETLALADCFGYKQLNITSKRVKNLVLLGYKDPEDDIAVNIITINAPDILSLTINGFLVLWKLLLLNVSSLVEANLNYIKRGHYETTIEETEEEMLKGFILNLHRVKELKIGVLLSRVLSRLEAKGFSVPSNTKFMKLPDDTSSSCSDDDSLSDSD